MPTHLYKLLIIIEIAKKSLYILGIVRHREYIENKNYYLEIKALCKIVFWR